MIKVVCSYCGEQYGAKDDGRGDVWTSHGACKVCAAIELAKLAAMDREDKTRAA